MKTFIGITGTTSVGKSAVAVELAKMLNTEIVSADSMQIYKDMDIGTAKISDEEKDGIKHHMLDVIEPCENYSSFLYQQTASQIIDKMTTLPIVVGGTGFYFDSLVYPPEFGGYNESRRLQLQAIAECNGIAALQHLLYELDEDTYNCIDLNNKKRLIRAIEIADSGTKKSQGAGRVNPRYNCKLFVLERNRENLYKQIDKRVDGMIAEGLINEVSDIIAKYGICKTSAFSAIGYKEIIEFLQGNFSIIDAINKIKLNTRHYAKRQITYFKRMNITERIEVENKSATEIAEYIYDKIKDIEH